MPKIITQTELDDRLYWYKAEVTSIVDGDTMRILVDMGLEGFRKPHKGIRLADINTPETYGVKKDSEEYAAGKKAKDRVIELAPVGSTVYVRTMQSSNPGKYGRYIMEVYVKSTGDEYVCLNDLLVEEGLAVVASY